MRVALTFKGCSGGVIWGGVGGVSPVVATGAAPGQDPTPRGGEGYNNQHILNTPTIGRR